MSDVRLKLSALWTSLMFLYIYNDYFQLYHPNYFQQMLHGQALFGATQPILFLASTVVAIPSLMIFLTLVLKPGVSRWAHIILGLLYTVINALSISGSWAHYVFYNVIEIALTLAIVRYAWTWSLPEPK
jgi:hypothetical protein